MFAPEAACQVVQLIQQAIPLLHRQSTGAASLCAESKDAVQGSIGIRSRHAGSRGHASKKAGMQDGVNVHVLVCGDRNRGVCAWRPLTTADVVG